jgi:hypothetical protein
MDGQPLERAKAAAQMVITHLGAEDRIGVVTFSDAARTIPLQPAANKAHLKGLITGIASEGMTSLTAGWMQGRDEVAKGSKGLPRGECCCLPMVRLTRELSNRHRSAKSSPMAWRMNVYAPAARSRCEGVFFWGSQKWASEPVASALR